MLRQDICDPSQARRVGDRGEAYSRNLVFADGRRMQRVFDTVVDRTRSRLDVKGHRRRAKSRPRRSDPWSLGH